MEGMLGELVGKYEFTAIYNELERLTAEQEQALEDVGCAVRYHSMVEPGTVMLIHHERIRRWLGYTSNPVTLSETFRFGNASSYGDFIISEKLVPQEVIHRAHCCWNV